MDFLRPPEYIGNIGLCYSLYELWAAIPIPCILLILLLVVPNIRVGGALSSFALMGTVFYLIYGLFASSAIQIGVLPSNLGNPIRDRRASMFFPFSPLMLLRGLRLLFRRYVVGVSDLGRLSLPRMSHYPYTSIDIQTLLLLLIIILLF